jgi:hypothetical protein
MSLTGPHLRERVELLLSAAEPSQEEVSEVLADGYGYVLSIDSQRLRLERRITELAANAEQPEAANELRRLWLRHRTIGAEVTSLRTLLRQLREAQPASS